MQIVIIGGFLGGGKTTTLNHLITDALDNNLKPAVLMNEFGKMSVDGQLIKQDVPMEEIVDGCICCAMKADVSEQLHQLYLDYQPDIVFIECSGVAEPLAVVDACLTPVLAPIIQIRSIVGIVDATIYERFDAYPEDIQKLFLEQLRHCSTLFVNKIDLVAVDSTAELLRKLESMNSNANILVGSYGSLSLKSLLEATNVGGHKSKILHGDIGHCYIEHPQMKSKSEFIDKLSALPNDVYRVKGFIRFIDEQHIYLVQYAQGEIELSPIQLTADVPLYLVIIGKNLDNIDIPL
ncbi:CobW family GTP-binding protein [Staphylococcus epidermidis]|uniref:CobW family GTP-binding protein n=1 Tax=Staphylococcus epidermidis TaxID=1282 RepID=UPI002DB6461F|nr:GTP-binding protein [Staphylococcus epidermidis]MEB7397868.1 GTP-binding protein [Staphylococcus epidermidis]